MTEAKHSTETNAADKEQQQCLKRVRCDDDAAAAAACAATADDAKGVAPQNQQLDEEAVRQPEPKKARRKKMIDMFNFDETDSGDDEEDEESDGGGEDSALGAAGAVLEGHDAFDDEEGYYKFANGVLLGTRYRVVQELGRGVFGSVLRCTDEESAHTAEADVAVKVARANETMRKAGQRETAVLRKLAAATQEKRQHSYCVLLRDQFDFRGHYCLVLEHMDMNLRQLLAKYGGGSDGISVGAVRVIAQQLFTALRHIHRCGYVHADIKLDNILVTERPLSIRVCDFGTALEPGNQAPTPYLASRFYRAPEAILGVPYDGCVDVWAAACCLAELYTGKVLFPGATNNGMLKLFCELCGAFPKRVLRRAALCHEHFDANYRFVWRDVVDATTTPPKVVLRTLIYPSASTAAELARAPSQPSSHNSTPLPSAAGSSSTTSTGGVTVAPGVGYFVPRSMKSVLCPTAGSEPATEADRALLEKLRDLLVKCLCLDNTRRLTAASALAHPFCSAR